MEQLETKPGYKTTEFWVTIATQVISLVALSGVLTPEQFDDQQWVQIVQQVGALVAMVGSAFGYTLSRGVAKQGVQPK